MTYVTASPGPSLQLSLLSFIQPQVQARGGSLAKFSVSLCHGSRVFIVLGPQLKRRLKELGIRAENNLDQIVKPSRLWSSKILPRT